jgi:NAD(P)-dependent dehydrogenase (short-subunit alcohol dehydrogenase family)
MISWVVSFLDNQLFTRIPKPTQNFQDKIVIVTGAYTGLGLEAAKHFVRLNASKVILACRNVEKGEAAKRAIETSTACHLGALEIWQLDLASHESVKQFASKANTPRLDVLLENAGMSTGEFRWAEKNESQITVNVVSTLLLELLLLPKLKATARDFGVTPHLTMVFSSLQNAAIFPERHGKNVFEELNNRERPS